MDIFRGGDGKEFPIKICKGTLIRKLAPFRSVYRKDRLSKGPYAERAHANSIRGHPIGRLYDPMTENAQISGVCEAVFATRS